MWQDASDAERLAVKRATDAIVDDVCYMADLLVAFLKSLGWRQPRKPRKKAGTHDEALLQFTPASKLSPEMREASGVLLNQAAALRISLWERAGLRPALPAELPTSNEAAQHLLQPENADSPEIEPKIPELFMPVFQTWFQRFSLSSRASLGTDIILPTQTVAKEEFLDSLADFLLNITRLTDGQEKP